MTEEWRSIPGFEGRYSASSFGRIRRDRHTVDDVTQGFARTRVLPERLVAGSPDEAGYLRGQFTFPDGKRRNRRFHQLVALAFHGQPPAGQRHVNHKDEDKSNNRPENLEWCSNYENAVHSMRRRHERGSRRFETKNAKLTEADIPTIRARLAAGDRRERIALDYGVSHYAITDIALNRRWRYVR